MSNFSGRVKRKLYSHIPIPLIIINIDAKRKKKDIKDSFKEKQIPFSKYCLDGGMPEDTMVMSRFGLLWQCYYVEMGKKWDRRLFISQSQACFYIYYSVLKTMTSIYNNNSYTKAEEKILQNFNYAACGIMKIENTKSSKS